ncbi:MAG TPA: competence/damage-inducible protein A [Conexibacter sp.]|nr:competence/damage-inducible protein A [Conexibacter sp.]
MSARAGIVITGTEVLSGIISDRNGPWLSERLRELGVELAHILIVGDRREDMAAALRFLHAEDVSLIVTSGGLGPTADDLTTEVVADFAGRPMVLDEALERRIAAIVAPIAERWPNVDRAAMARGTRKQAHVPEGATVLEPVGTAPGAVVPPSDGAGPTVVVLPGPPRELQPMWAAARKTEAFRTAVAGATEYEQAILRLMGIPESEIAETLVVAEQSGLDLAPLEITTCLRRGEIEIATLYEPGAEDAYAAFAEFIRARHAAQLFSEDGSTIDEQVAALLSGPPLRTIAVAESCTGGLLAGRLTERPGSSAYVLGGVVVYADAAKVALADVDPALLERHGAVSAEVADALADGALARFGADVGVGVTGVAGPGGGTREKPVGRVHVAVADRSGARIARRLDLPGSRPDVRDRTTTVALHLLRRLLLGDTDTA